MHCYYAFFEKIKYRYYFLSEKLVFGYYNKLPFSVLARAFADFEPATWTYLVDAGQQLLLLIVWRGVIEDRFRLRQLVRVVHKHRVFLRLLRVFQQSLLRILPFINALMDASHYKLSHGAGASDLSPLSGSLQRQFGLATQKRVLAHFLVLLPLVADRLLEQRQGVRVDDILAGVDLVELEDLRLLREAEQRPLRAHRGVVEDVDVVVSRA